MRAVTSPAIQQVEIARRLRPRPSGECEHESRSDYDRRGFQT
jgi:hypothetical protein